MTVLPASTAAVGAIVTVAAVFDVIASITALYVFVPETAMLILSPTLSSVPKSVLKNKGRSFFTVLTRNELVSDNECQLNLQ